jgi:hypothetical protein
MRSAMASGRAMSTVPAVAFASAGWQDDGDGSWKTEYGPAYRTAQKRGERKSVPTVGDQFVDGHTELDRQAVKCGRMPKIAAPVRRLTEAPSAHGQAFRTRRPGTRSDPQLNGAVVGALGQRRRPRSDPGSCVGLGFVVFEALNDVN